MTKLRWEKTGLREQDPGTVISVLDTDFIDRRLTPQQRDERKTERERANELLFKRSDELRYKAMIEKFGEQRALALGVPSTFIEARKQAKLQQQKQQEQAILKRLGRLNRNNSTVG